MQADVCPAPGEMLLAISAEFHAFDVDAASFALDDLARGLFEVGDERREASHRLATLLTDELRLYTDQSSVDGIFLDTVLARHTGHPLTLAVLAAEIGRRAGLAVGVCSTPTGWYAGLGEHLRGRLPIGRHA